MSAPDEGKVMWYDLDVTNGGNFNLWFLTQGPDAYSDSFWISVDGGPDTQLTAGAGWGWVKLGATTFSIPTGKHSLKIKVGEDSARVDKIALTKSATVPIDTDPAITCGCLAETDPTFCARYGANCGMLTGTDTCGLPRTVPSCGTCTSPATCGGSGIPNLCGSPDRTEGGTVTSTGTSCNANETAVKAYDNLMTSANFTKWCITQKPTTSSPRSTVYDFSGSTAFAIKRYAITTANDVPGRDPKNWTFQGCQAPCTVGSNSGWTTLDTRTNQFVGAARFQTKSYTFTNNTAYQKYRLRITCSPAS